MQAAAISLLTLFGTLMQFEPFEDQLHVPRALTYKNFAFCPMKCICVFRKILTINSDYFSRQH
jgi:hypothetical protein